MHMEAGYLSHTPVFSDWGRLLVDVETFLMLSSADPPSTAEHLWMVIGSKNNKRSGKSNQTPELYEYSVASFFDFDINSMSLKLTNESCTFLVVNQIYCTQGPKTSNRLQTSSELQQILVSVQLHLC